MKIRLIVTVILAAVVFSAAVTTSADGITRRIKFAKGKRSTVVSGAVLRGDLDTYIVGAKSGQMMYTRITSLENNAVFSIKGPDGEYLQDVGEEDDRTDATSDLPYDGDYKLIVGGTRGNASYKLTVSIK
jgi:hypothetical protein